MLGRGNPTLVFHFFKKFLATCTSSVPPSSCLGANKAASYPKTRAKCRSPLAILLPHGSGYSLLLTPAVTFPVRAHDCRITAWRTSTAPAPFLFINLSPLGISCPSFLHSLSLFSTSCSLFRQNTGGVGTLCDHSAPSMPLCPWHSACIGQGQYGFEAVQTRGKGRFSFSSFLLSCRLLSEATKESLMDTFADHFRRDMRLAQRHCVKADLRVRIWKSETPEQHAESINLSEGGIFFVTDAAFQRGETIEVFLQMPQEVTGEPATDWRCTGQVVRVEPVDSPVGKLGVGVRFDCYEVSRSEATGSPATMFPPSRFGLEIEAAHAKTSSHR